jgi:hypothetical protein
MKNVMLGCFVTLLLASASGRAQTSDAPDPGSTGQLAARCAYTPTDDACKSFSSSREETQSRDGYTAQAQFPRRGPYGRPPMSRRPYGPRPYAYGSYDDGRHAAIGGLIGFGAGFALGAGANQNSSTRVGTGLIVGALGAVFGAAIGHGIETFPHASFRRHRWSDDDESASTRPPQRETPRSPPAGD